MTAFHSEAVALFGSVARNTADRLSDKDVLLVDDSEFAIRSDDEKLTRNGWSVAKYSWKRLNTLCERRALFVQHLKLEARVIVDRNGRLRNLLGSFQPAAAYTNDIDQAIKLLTLLESVPDSVEGIGWAHDVLAVGTRILGIAYLANEGRYAFGLREVYRGLAEIGCISHDDSHVLSHLRMMKSAYRRRDWCSVASSARLFEIMRVLRRLGVDVGCEIKSVSAVAGFRRPIVHGYAYLRAAERDYWMLANAAVGDEEELNFLRRRLGRILSNPQDYAASARTTKAVICDLLSRIERLSV